MSNFKQKLFSAKSLDIEQIVLNAVDQIMLSPLKVAELGDATKVNRMTEGLVLNLDAFVSRILLAEEAIEDSDYQKKRKAIIERWPKDTVPNMELVRDLFKLTIEELQKRRLFKVRRQSYFGMGWKKKQQANLNALQKQEEVEGEEPSEEEGELVEVQS